MALSIYTTASASSKLSQDGEFTNPFSLTFDGRTGGTIETRLYVRNDSALYYYTDIQLTVSDTGATNITDNEDGFYWKFSAGDTQPTANEWRNISAANTIDLPDLGSSGSPDTSTYLPFWLYVQIPPSVPIQVFDDVKFVLTGEEVLI